MQYLGLLRGINVGGKSIISMQKLKDMFTSLGFTHVRTYIQSGNILFVSSDTNEQKIIQHIEEALQKHFGTPIRVVLKTKKQLQQVLEEVPTEWHSQADLRCYIAFVYDVTKPETVVQETQPKPGVDTITAGTYAVYLTTKMSGITQSGFAKLSGKKVYKEITIRNYSTAQKLLALMEASE